MVATVKLSIIMTDEIPNPMAAHNTNLGQLAR